MCRLSVTDSLRLCRDIERLAERLTEADQAGTGKAKESLNMQRNL
jgi:hypothetical protein